MKSKSPGVHPLGFSRIRLLVRQARDGYDERPENYTLLPILLMLAAFTYGRAQRLEFHVPVSVDWAELGVFPTSPVADVRKSLQAMLAAPRDFPSLNQAVVPGDQ